MPRLPGCSTTGWEARRHHHCPRRWQRSGRLHRRGEAGSWCIVTRAPAARTVPRDRGRQTHLSGLAQHSDVLPCTRPHGRQRRPADKRRGTDHARRALSSPREPFRACRRAPQLDASCATRLSRGRGECAAGRRVAPHGMRVAGLLREMDTQETYGTWATANDAESRSRRSRRREQHRNRWHEEGAALLRS